jgi:anti-anti-sigma factor
MVMSMDVRMIRGVAILDLRGNCLDDRNFNLAEQVRQLLASGEKRILVNLSSADDVSGMYGFGNVVRAYTACQKEGGELRLIKPRKQFRTVLQYARMTSILAVYSDEDEALASFK